MFMPVDTLTTFDAVEVGSVVQFLSYRGRELSAGFVAKGGFNFRGSKFLIYSDGSIPCISKINQNSADDVIVYNFDLQLNFQPKMTSSIEPGVNIDRGLLVNMDGVFLRAFFKGTRQCLYVRLSDFEMFEDVCEDSYFPPCWSISFIQDGSEIPFLISIPLDGVASS